MGMLLLLPVAMQAQNVAQRVMEDAIVLDRVAQASKRDLPSDLLKRIVDEDIDLMRGKRADGTYQYATFERFDSGRIAESFSIQAHGDKMQTVELKGAWVYRAVVEVPTRRLLVRKNRPVWIERVDFDYIGERSNATEHQSVDVKAWQQPGEVRPLDLPAVARQANVRVVAYVDDKGGYGNIDVTLIKAKIVDVPDSPYADVVASAKAVQRALDNNDIPSIRAMAQRMRGSLGNAAPVAAVRTTEARPAESVVEVKAPAPQPEMLHDLQVIEDLLTGSEQEKREGLDRLHQLIRKLRQ
jgi:hypothetical protein